MDIHEIFTDRTEKVEGVEIMNTYGNSLNIPFTEDDLNEFVKTFSETKEKYRPNLKVDHSTHQLLVKKLLGIDKTNTELPNLGFFDNLRVVGKSLFADIVEIPAKIKDLLFNGQFKGLSPELYTNFRGTGKKFIESVVLTNYPRFKHQYNLSEKDLGFSGEIIEIEEVKKMSDKDNAITKEDIKLVEDQVEKSLLSKFSDLFRGKEKENNDIVDKTKINSLEAENIFLRKQVDDLNGQMKQFSEAFSSLSDKTRKESVDSICEKAIVAGVKPSTVEHFKPLLYSEISEDKMKFSDAEGKETEKSVKEYIVDFFESQKGQIDFSDRTFTTSVAPGAPAHDDKQKQIEENAKTFFSEFKQQGLSDFEAWDKAFDKANDI